MSVVALGATTTEAAVFPPQIQRRHARRLIACLATVLGALSVAAAKEETAWTFEVRELVELGPMTHILHLIPAPTGIHFPRTCEVFVVQAHFERGKGVPPAYQNEFMAEDYDGAIRELQRAKVKHELVRLASLAGGFGRLEGAVDECVVLSSGLAVLLDRDQQSAIFSVF